MSSKSNDLLKVIVSRSSKPRLRTRQNNSNTNDSIPTLKEFMHRQKVISQYRGFLKAIRNIDDINAQRTMKNEVRTGFKSMIHEKDKISISMALKEVGCVFLFNMTMHDI